jgi:hypothetical protein
VKSLVRVLSNVDVRGATAWDVPRGQAIENRVGIDTRFDCWAITTEYVNRRGDENELHYPSTIAAQPVFSRPNADREFPLATQAAAEVLCLPCFAELTDGEVDQVVEAVNTGLAEVM